MDKNKIYARKAALLDPICQIYKCGQFDWVTPSTFFMFNGWFYRFDAATNARFSSHPNFHRNLGVERYTLVPAGTRIIGTNDSSFIYGALPDQLIADFPGLYAEGEAIYWSRMSRLDVLPFFQVGSIRFPNAPVLPDCKAWFPADQGRGLLLTAITSHGGCWTALQGPNVPRSNPPRNYIINTLDEINDGHEIRFTSGIEGLQPFCPEMFDHIYLGAGNRSDTYGLPHTEATWCGAQGFILPPDW